MTEAFDCYLVDYVDVHPWDTGRDGVAWSYMINISGDIAISALAIVGNVGADSLPNAELIAKRLATEF